MAMTDGSGLGYRQPCQECAEKADPDNRDSLAWLNSAAPEDIDGAAQRLSGKRNV